jgi:predicted phage-related endonuclease
MSRFIGRGATERRMFIGGSDARIIMGSDETSDPT